MMLYNNRLGLRSSHGNWYIAVIVAVLDFSVVLCKSSDLLYVIPMTSQYKDQWVDSHNYFRRNVSNPEASNMRLMSWDDGLASLAERVVKTCSNTHTPLRLRKTSVFDSAGENLFNGGKHRMTTLMTRKGVTKEWYDEVKYYDYYSSTCKHGKECGHYKQIAWADSFKIGCAVAKCKRIDKGYGPFFVSCNYGPGGNIFYEDGVALKPYIFGKPCSKCQYGDSCDNQLCKNTVRDGPFTTTTTMTTSSGIHITRRWFDLQVLPTIIPLMIALCAIMNPF